MGAKLATELSPDTNPIAFVWNATIGAGKDDGSWDRESTPSPCFLSLYEM